MICNWYRFENGSEIEGFLICMHVCSIVLHLTTTNLYIIFTSYHILYKYSYSWVGWVTRTWHIQLAERRTTSRMWWLVQPPTRWLYWIWLSWINFISEQLKSSFENVSSDVIIVVVKLNIAGLFDMFWHVFVLLNFHFCCHLYSHPLEMLPHLLIW